MFSVSADFYLISVVAENMGNFLKANFLGVLKVRESRVGYGGGGLWYKFTVLEKICENVVGTCIRYLSAVGFLKQKKNQ